MIKKYLWMVLLLAGWQNAWSFAWLGPTAPPNGADAWETTAIGYDLAIDVGKPRDIGQEYRRNIPIIYYAYDPSFLTYFGSNGVVAVDAAAAVFNNLTNVDQLDPTQFPFDSQGYNYEAMSLYMYDIKSTTVYLLLEQLGLAQPERYTWTLQARIPIPPGTCPIDIEYLVIQRNFATTNVPDTQIQYSPYVNNLLYTYAIDELCPPNNPLALTIPYSLDPLADQYSSVASGLLYNFGGLQYGGFYDGLTFDDVAGLKVLLSTNTINEEKVTGSDLLTSTTNYAGGQVLFPANANIVNMVPPGYGTFNLGALLTSSVTNAPAALPGLFPGVVVNTSLNYWTTVTNQAVTATYVPPGNGYPYGSPMRLSLATNYSIALQEQYVTTFANVITNHYSPTTKAILQTIATGVPNGSPYGSPVTSTTNYTTVTLNQPSGDFYVLPQFAGTNLCGSGISYFILTNTVYTTNLITTATTNAPTAVTTGTTTTITNAGYTYTQSLITWYNSYIYVAYPVTCAETANPANLYQGIQHVQFVREDYDSLLGQAFQPETFDYSMVAVTNSQYVTQNFTRTVTAPEIIMEAGDYLDDTYVYRSITFDTTEAIAGEAGPGVINPVTAFEFNTDVNAYFNGEPVDLNPIPASGYLPGQSTEYFPPYLTWASFDGTTNAPILYPSGADLQNLANQMLVLVSPAPAALPPGAYGAHYDQQFTATTTRYSSWSWSAANLPPGLTFTNLPAAGVPNPVGVLSGVPTDPTGVNAPLTYDIIVTLTGILSNSTLTNSVQWTYPLTIY